MESIVDKSSALNLNNDSPSLQFFSDYRSFLTELSENGFADGCIKPPMILQETLAKQLVAISNTSSLPISYVEILEFVKRITKKSRACFSTVILTLFYLNKYWTTKSQLKGSSFITGSGVKAQVIAAMILADKYMYDIAMANSEWAKVSQCFTIQQINSFELEFFGHLDFNIQFSGIEYQNFLSSLEISLGILNNQVDIKRLPISPPQIIYLFSNPLFSNFDEIRTHLSTSPTLGVFFEALLVCWVAYCAIILSLSKSVVQRMEKPKSLSPERSLDWTSVSFWEIEN